MTKVTFLQGGAIGVLCLGIGFGAGIVWPGSGTPTPDRIEISAEVFGLQVYEREAMLGRDLTEQEIDMLAERQTAYEIMVREAARMGVHLKDADIRKHMVSVMQHVMSTSLREPSAEELTAYLTENSERYMTPRKVTFEHVFFEKDKSAADAWYDITLSHGEIPADVGDIFWLGRRMEEYSASQLLTVLGNKFVKQLRNLPLNEWSEPIQSARGVHLVRVENFYEPEPLPAAEMQSRLRADWKKKQEFLVFEREIAKLSEGYTIVLPDETAMRNVVSRHASRASNIWKAAEKRNSE